MSLLRIIGIALSLLLGSLFLYSGLGMLLNVPLLGAENLTGYGLLLGAGFLVLGVLLNLGGLHRDFGSLS